MEVIFLKSGESPEIGVFEIGDERPIPDKIAKDFRDRGICKYKRHITADKPKKGVRDNG